MSRTSREREKISKFFSNKHCKLGKYRIFNYSRNLNVFISKTAYGFYLLPLFSQLQNGSPESPFEPGLPGGPLLPGGPCN